MDVSSRDGRLVVVNGNWGDTTLAAVLEVLDSVYGALTEAFGAEPDAPVSISHWTQPPLTVFDRRPHEVLLNARSRYWSQYAYQFSHELCHILTGHDRYRKHRYRWFDESICELASLYTLYRLESAWRADPPRGVPGAKQFAPHHREYAESRREQHRLPDGTSLPDWFATHRPLLESGTQRRDLYTTIGGALVDCFLGNPGLWRDVHVLNQWDPREDASFGRYLGSWKRCVQAAGGPGLAPETIRRILGVGSA